ncbi:hypothetical protein DJ568_11835 [Mucilaginibacter hurinus]|uniref:TonB C-terminal domain-containing protein n=1 Tax=Mucilaginibacter hurinus TaxID=2201324 RepID=A0A367GN92_9SPHI|nr:hypothetical protein [Mucilaginibacter hurinus]RCH54508.1 hypothetical protein DJ568_11835 [Mucilaginibacter hurinus]
MKKIILVIFSVVIAFAANAQQKLAFPFQGGKTVMQNFFRDSLKVSKDVINKKAVGSAVFKFTANEYGQVKKIIVYYADDAILVKSIIEALQKSDRKWIIPDGEKTHDFILPFSINFNTSPTSSDQLNKQLFDYYSKRQPIVSFDQVPLDMATLLPTIIVKYDIK